MNNILILIKNMKKLPDYIKLLENHVEFRLDVYLWESHTF